MFRLLAFVALVSFSWQSVAAMDRYQRNQCEDRAVYITILSGLAATVALITPGAYVLAPKGDYNMQPNCPAQSPVSCCDAKLPTQNATTSPENCSAVSGINCLSPKVAFCYGATVPAEMTYQSWAIKTGVPLIVFGAMGFLVSVGAAVTGCCIGTCGFG